MKMKLWMIIDESFRFLHSLCSQGGVDIIEEGCCCNLLLVPYICISTFVKPIQLVTRTANRHFQKGTSVNMDF